MSSFKLRLSRTATTGIAIVCGIAIGVVFYLMRPDPKREAILDGGVVAICEENPCRDADARAQWRHNLDIHNPDIVITPYHEAQLHYMRRGKDEIVVVQSSDDDTWIPVHLMSSH